MEPASEYTDLRKPSYKVALVQPSLMGSSVPAEQFVSPSLRAGDRKEANMALHNAHQQQPAYSLHRKHIPLISGGQQQ